MTIGRSGRAIGCHHIRPTGPTLVHMSAPLGRLTTADGVVLARLAAAAVHTRLTGQPPDGRVPAAREAAARAALT